MAQPFLGEIRMFAGSSAPEGWRVCDGSALDVDDYSELFALIGTTYGGDGVSAFHLPDLRGKLPVGQGAGPGLSNRTMGQQFGTNDEALTTANLPAHSHAINGSSDTAEAITPGPTLTLGTPAGSLFYSAGTGKRALNNQAFGSIGGGTAHTNQMRTLSINYIIAVSGAFPSGR
jgi:microcystin-dependent protein